MDMFRFTNFSDVTIQGKGKIDGFGYDWWLGCYTGAHDLYHTKRPNLIQF